MSDKKAEPNNDRDPLLDPSASEMEAENQQPEDQKQDQQPEDQLPEDQLPEDQLPEDQQPEEQQQGQNKGKQETHDTSSTGNDDESQSRKSQEYAAREDRRTRFESASFDIEFEGYSSTSRVIKELEARLDRQEQYRNALESEIDGTIDLVVKYRYQWTLEKVTRLIHTLDEQLSVARARRAEEQSGVIKDDKLLIELRPLEKMLMILLSMVQEIPWDLCRQIFEHIVNHFGGRPSFVFEGHDRGSEQQKFATRQDSNTTFDSEQNVIIELKTRQETFFDIQFSATAKAIFANRYPERERRQVILQYPPELCCKNLARVVPDHFDIVMEIGLALIIFCSKGQTSRPMRWKCAEGLGRILHTGANFLLDKMLYHWIDIPTGIESGSLRALLGHSLRTALEDGLIEADEIRNWFQRWHNLRMKNKNRVLWAMASACKEISRQDPVLAMEELGNLYLIDEFESGDLKEVRKAVVYSLGTLIQKRQFKDVLVGLSLWTQRKVAKEQHEVYLEVFFDTLRYLIDLAQEKKDEDIDSSTADYEVLLFLGGDESEVDEALVSAYKAVALLIKLDLISKIREQSRAILIYLREVFNLAMPDLINIDPRIRIYAKAFSCLRDGVLGLGGDLRFKRRLRRILIELFSLIAADTIENLDGTVENPQGYDTAMMRFSELLKSLFHLWSIKDRDDLLLASKDGKTTAKETRLEGFYFLLQEYFDEAFWTKLEGVLALLMILDNEKVPVDLCNLVELILDWGERFALNEDTHPLRRAHLVLSRASRLASAKSANIRQRRLFHLRRSVLIEELLRQLSVETKPKRRQFIQRLYAENVRSRF